MSQEESLEAVRSKMAEQRINVANPGKLHLVTTHSRFSIGGHGGKPFGLIFTMCNEVAEYIEKRAEDAYRGLELPVQHCESLEMEVTQPEVEDFPAFEEFHHLRVPHSFWIIILRISPRLVSD